jgi:hypothetical protein
MSKAASQRFHLRWFQRHLDTAPQHLAWRFAVFFTAVRRAAVFAFRKIVGELGRRAPRKRAIGVAAVRIDLFETKKAAPEAPPFVVSIVEPSGP